MFSDKVVAGVLNKLLQKAQLPINYIFLLLDYIFLLLDEEVLKFLYAYIADPVIDAVMSMHKILFNRTSLSTVPQL